MINGIQHALCEAILKHYGEMPQYMKALEEQGECCAAIARYAANPTDENRGAMAREIADEFVMLEQVMIASGTKMEVYEAIEHKLSRQMDRIRRQKEQDYV